jgi:type I restriction enzyme S subunit
MNELWEDVTLEQVANDVTVGHVGPMADQYVEVGIPFLRSLNVEPFIINTNDLKQISHEFHLKLKKSALKPGDIVIVRTGKPGACAVIPDWLPEANCSDVVVVRANSKVRPSFISFVVNSSATHHINTHTVGAVQQHFNVGSARQIRFRLPPLAEQDRILAVLGALNDKIELNRCMNETLEATARAIFRDWFVDFGPTRAKMEGRAPYLAPNIWSLFPDHLDDGDKPEGWVSGTLGDIAKQVGESVSPEILDPNTPYIGLEHMPRRSIALTAWEGAGKVTSGKLAFRKGDFLFGKLRPYFHKVGVAPFDGICSTDIVVLNARERKTAAFVLACLPIQARQVPRMF